MNLPAAKSRPQRAPKPLRSFNATCHEQRFSSWQAAIFPSFFVSAMSWASKAEGKYASRRQVLGGRVTGGSGKLKREEIQSSVICGEGFSLPPYGCYDRRPGGDHHTIPGQTG
jgi:hypothetical protein